MIYRVRFFTLKPSLGLIGALVALILMVAPGAAVLAADDSSATRMPGAVVVQPSHDFGSVMEDTEIKHDFIIENHGAGVLEIHKVEPS